MTAHSEHFPWPSHSGEFEFFESRMRAHQRVHRFNRTEHAGLYLLNPVDGGELKVFVCECYSFGVAEYHEVVEKLGNVDAVVISSAWCGYTSQAKEYTREQHVGLFKIGELMGALNKPRLRNISRRRSENASAVKVPGDQSPSIWVRFAFRTEFGRSRHRHPAST